MRALPSATTLCRVLVGLDRACARGRLHVAARGRSSTMSVDAGNLLAARIDRRVSTSHRQALEQLVEVCGWDGIVLRFAPTNAPPHGTALLDPLAVKTFGLSAMRLAIKGVPSASVRAQLGTEEYRLSEAGEALVSGVELRPEEAEVVVRLRRGVLTEEILALPGAGLAGCRFLWMLKLLGGAAPRATGSYPLLLRKRRELRRQASAHALLDLPEGAGSRDARVALRKLVRDIHPDRFGAGTPPALRRASGEIVTALVCAEARIASGQAC